MRPAPRASPASRGPRRTWSPGHGTRKRFTLSGPRTRLRPSTRTSARTPYQPGSRLAKGMSNGTRISPRGEMSTTVSSSDTACTAFPRGSTTDAPSSRIWCGSGSAPRITTAPRTEAGKRSNTASTLTGPSASSTRLGALLPGAEVGLLLRSEGVDLDAHGLELQPGHLGVDLGLDRVHGPFQALRVPDDPLDAQRLVRERHVHHRRGMALGGCQV